MISPWIIKKLEDEANAFRREIERRPHLQTPHPLEEKPAFPPMEEKPQRGIEDVDFSIL